MEVLNVEKLTPVGSELKRLMSADGSEIQTVPHLAQALEIPEFDAWGLFDGSTEVDDAMAEKLGTAFGTAPGIPEYWLARWRQMQVAKLSTVSRQFDAEALNKRLISALATILHHYKTECGEICPRASYPASLPACDLLSQIGVLIETADGQYEFAPGFDPATGEWL